MIPPLSCRSFWVTQLSSAPGEKECGFGNKTFSPLNALLLCLLWGDTYYLLLFKSLRTYSKNLKIKKRNTPASHKPHLSPELFRAMLEDTCAAPSRNVPDFFQLIKKKMHLVTVPLNPYKQITSPYPWIKHQNRIQEAFCLSHSAGRSAQPWCRTVMCLSDIPLQNACCNPRGFSFLTPVFKWSSGRGRNRKMLNVAHHLRTVKYFCPST